jgi:predicted DNA-binding transcriptional regulator AlpA
VTTNARFKIAAGKKRRPYVRPAPAPLPDCELVRLPQLLAAIPVAPSTIWKYIQEGMFPRPLKLSPRVTVWRTSEVREWIAKRAADNAGAA